VSESNRTTKQNTAQNKKKKHLQQKNRRSASACFPRSSSCHGTAWHDHTILRSDGDVKAHATYKTQITKQRTIRRIAARANGARESTLFNVARVKPCLVLSCLVSLECTLWEGFSGACRSRPTLYRAEHHTPVGRVLRSYSLEPSRGIVRLLHMYCPSSTIKL